MSAAACQTASSGIEAFVADEFYPVCPSRHDTPETIRLLSEIIDKWEAVTGLKVRCR